MGKRTENTPKQGMKNFIFAGMAFVRTEEKLKIRVFRGALTSLVKGAPLPDGTNIYRVSTEGPYNFDFNPRELAAIESGKLNPPGVSVIRAGSPEEATGIWNKAFPNRPATSVGEMNAQEIRAAGYDVIHDPSKGALGEHHARLIHPDGVKGFNADKDKLTTKFMKCSC